MAKHINKLLLPIAILCTAVALPAAHAEQPQAATGTPGLLAVQLPGVDREELVDLVTTLRSQLILRKQELVQTVEDSHFGGSDAILAAILPGGLLYAGFQKARHEQAREELEQVNAEIEQYSSDILAMQPAPSPVAIVQLP
jgi:pyruvate/oxaloacetate carboxyltransferase